MIRIDKETFEKIVLAATSSTAEVFDMMSDRFDISKTKLKANVFGTVLDIDNLPDAINADAERFIYMDAFTDAIPMLDLVLTPTGFGVVSNQNVAPASRDRVESLRKLAKECADDAMDNIIVGLLGNNAWDDSGYAKLLVSSLYYTGSQLRDYAGKQSAHRSDLLLLRPLIYEAEELIIRQLSSVMYHYLLSQIRQAVLLDYETLLVYSLNKAIGFYINNKKDSFKRELNNAVNVMEGDLEKFPVYRDSEAYKVKHFEFYKNEKDDSCYFFG